MTQPLFRTPSPSVRRAVESFAWRWSKGRLRSLPGKLWATIRTWIARRRQRSALAELDDHLLKDIGVSREDALREVDKPFWRR
jgi:uncharacterized protein YjiS (DUF1127 family)